LEDEKDQGEKKTAAEGGDKGSSLMGLLLKLRDSTEDESLKGQIDEAIMKLAEGDGAPAMPAAAAQGQEEPRGGPTQARAAARSSADAGQDDVLGRRMAALERRLDTDACTRLIQANRDLIPEASPALELWALKQTPNNLDAWVRAQRTTRPKAAPPGGHQAQQRKQASTAGAGGETGEFDAEAVQLTDADRRVLKRTGGNPKEFLTHKRQLAARKAGVDWEPAAAKAN
jgi:hypothetical protein